MRKIIAVIGVTLVLISFLNLVATAFGFSDMYYFIFPTEAPNFFTNDKEVIVEDNTPLAAAPKDD